MDGWIRWIRWIRWMAKMTMETREQPPMACNPGRECSSNTRSPHTLKRLSPILPFNTEKKKNKKSEKKKKKRKKKRISHPAWGGDSRALSPTPRSWKRPIRPRPLPLCCSSPQTYYCVGSGWRLIGLGCGVVDVMVVGAAADVDDVAVAVGGFGLANARGRQ